MQQKLIVIDCRIIGSQQPFEQISNPAPQQNEILDFNKVQQCGVFNRIMRSPVLAAVNRFNRS